MQLRKSITAPIRLEDEEPAVPPGGNGTKPARPDLMKANVIPFNPDNRPAAFPSLPLTKALPVANRFDAEQTTAVSETTVSDSQKTTTDEPEAISLSPSLAGNSSEDYEHTQSQVDLTNEQDADQQDNRPNGVASWESVTVMATRGARSSTSATQEARTVNHDEPRSPESLDTPVQINRTAEWSELPLSLQYRIYQAIRAKSPSDAKFLEKALGLTKDETKEIKEVVGLRALHPATTEQLTAFCSSISTPVPGLHPGFIDEATHREYIDYMVFASKHEYASVAHVRHAKGFLSARGITYHILGTWMPSDTDAFGVGGHQHVSSVRGRRAQPPQSLPYTLPGPRAQTNSTVTRRDSRQAVREQSLEAPPLPILSSLPLLASHYKPGSAQARKLAEMKNIWADPARRQLPASPPQARRKINLQAGEKSLPQLLQAARQLIAPVPKNTTAREDPVPILEAHGVLYEVCSADSADLQARSNPGESGAPTSPQAAGHAESTGDKGKGVECVQMGSAPQPLPPSQRLVLKVQENTGLAQVFRKPPPQSAPNSLTTAAPSSPVQPAASIARLSAPADAPLKRKASQPDLRPEANKAPRLVTDNLPAIPQYAFVSEPPPSEKPIPSKPKDPHTTAPGQVQSSAATSPIAPPISPISENADLPDFQALLEPVKGRVKGPKKLKLTVGKKSRAAAQREEEAALAARAVGLLSGRGK